MVAHYYLFPQHKGASIKYIQEHLIEKKDYFICEDDWKEYVRERYKWTGPNRGKCDEFSSSRRRHTPRRRESLSVERSNPFRRDNREESQNNRDKENKATKSQQSKNNAVILEADASVSRA